MSRVLLGDEGAGPARLSYPHSLIPNGNERPLWEVGDVQPMVAYKLPLAHVFLGFTPS